MRIFRYAKWLLGFGSSTQQLDAALAIAGLLNQKSEIGRRLDQQGELISLIAETHAEIEEVIKSRAMDRQEDHAPKLTFDENFEHARRNLDKARAFNGKPPLYGSE